MKIGIVLPVYISNEKLNSFLIPLTNSIQTIHNFEFILIENYIAPEFKPIKLEFAKEPINIITLKPEGEQSVSKAWNMGIGKAIDLGCEYVVVLNLDTKLDPKCIDELIKFAETCPVDFILWTGNDVLDENMKNTGYLRNFFQPDFSLFMVGKEFLEITKGFDENFKPYGDDDWDMLTRIEAMKLEATRVMTALFYHAGSQTIKTDKEYSKNVDPEHNRQLFIKKWGKPPGFWRSNSYYKHPFNDPKKGINEW